MAAPDSETAEALDSAAILARVRALAPRVRESADEVEALRRLPDALVKDLSEAGVFRIAMPRAWGGPEMPPLDQIELIETLSIADASVGWCACILSDSGFYASFLDEDVARGMYTDLDMRTAGMLAPVGRAERVDGGFRANGRWAFGSGSLHADWICGGCLIFEDGKPVVGDDGIPLWRILFFEPGDVEIHDTWHVTGLRGSGSNHYSVDDLFVPEERSFDVLVGSVRPEPLYRYHGLFFANIPGIPLGLGRAAIDAMREIAERKSSMPEGLLADQYRAQVAMGEAEALLGAARSYVWDVMGDLWQTLEAGGVPTMEQRARVAIMMTHAGQTGRQVVELACSVVGSEALYAGHPLERMRRDAIAMTSHLVHQTKNYALAGQVLLGRKPLLTYF